jgi:hypothetical protein
MRLSSSGIFRQLTPFRLLFIYYIFIHFGFEFAELFECEIRPGLWAIAGNQIFFVRTKDLKLGWYRPWLLLFIYIHFLASQSL